MESEANFNFKLLPLYTNEIAKKVVIFYLKKKVILVSHGKLSEGMMHSIQMIIGKNEAISCYGMMPGEHYSTIVDAIKVDAKANPETQYIIIADLFGGSVCNGCTSLTDLPNVKLISGMNMGLVIEIVLAEAPVSDEMIAEGIKNCKEGITHVSNHLVKLQSDNSDETFF